MSISSTGGRTYGADSPRVPRDFSTTPQQPPKNDPMKSFLWHLLAQLEVELIAFMALADPEDSVSVADKAAFELHRVGLLAAFRHAKQVAALPTLPADPLIDLEDLQEVHDFLTMQEKDGSADLRFVAQAKAKLQELMGRGVKS